MTGGTLTASHISVDEFSGRPDLGRALRPLGASEHLTWLLDRHRSANAAMAAQVDGPTTVQQWRAALDAAQQRHPLLSVRIESADPHAPRFVRVPTARIPMRVVPGADDLRWRAELARELPVAFESGHAPLVRAIVVLGHQKSICILIGHHAIVDGKALTYVIRDVLRALAGERLAALPVPPSKEALLADAVVLPADSSLHSARQPAPPGPPAIFRPKTVSAVSIDRLRLSPALTDSLRQRARNERTTVHGVLCAALVRAARSIREHWQNAPLRVITPIDVRDEIGAADACGMFLSVGNVTVEADAPLDLWELARIIKFRLMPSESLASIVATSADLHRLAQSGLDAQTAADVHAHALPHDLIVTNLGVVPLAPAYRNLRVENVWGPIVLPRMHRTHVIGVATTNGALCMVQTSLEPFSGLLKEAEALLIAATR